MSSKGSIQDGAVTTTKIADGNVTTSKIADANVTDAKFASGILPTKIAQGFSASGSAGTTVADLVADANKQLVALSIVVAQTNTTSTQFTITVTYSDSTTTTLTSTAATAQTAIGNNAGIILTTAGAEASLTALLVKKVTEVKVTTASTGVGTRAATLSAIEVPI